MSDIACGVRYDQDGNPILATFAAKVNAAFVEQWADLGLYDEGLGSFALAFDQAVNRTIAQGGRIHFSLDALDVGEALAGDPGESVGRYTAWELQQIVRKAEWFKHTVFYLHDMALTSDQLAAMGIALHELE